MYVFRRAERAAAAMILTVAAATQGVLTAAPSLAGTPVLGVAVSASSSSVASGGSLTWSVVATNNGGAAVDSVRLTDQVNGLNGLILTSSAGSCDQTSNLVSCNLGTLAGGSSATITIRGTVTASAGTTLNDTATASGNKASTTFTASGSGSSLVSSGGTGSLADLSLGLTAPSTVAASGIITYSLTVNNTGSANATGVKVVDTIPAGSTFESSSVTSGTSLFTCVQDQAAVACTGGAVNAGANASITIRVKVPASFGSLVDSAVVDPENLIPENNELNNTAQATTVIATSVAGKLSLAKTASPAQWVRPGDTLTYKMVATNTGSSRADSISVTDGTQGLDAASVKATTTKGSCTVSASKVTCTQVSPTLRLNAGEVMTVIVSGTVVGTPGSVVINTATLTGNISNKAVQTTATASVTIRPGVDLTTTQLPVATCSVSCPPFRARDTFDDVIVVGNSGLDDATGVTVREPLPADVLFAGFTDTNNAGFTCSLPAPTPSPTPYAYSTGVVTCTGGVVKGVTNGNAAGGTTAKIVLHLVAPDSIGPITGTVTVDPFNSIAEGDEQNNTFTTTTPIETGIDLTPTQAVNVEPVAPSGTLVYTVTVTNNGTQDTTGVRLTDTLPVGTRYRLAVGDHGLTCTSDGALSGGTVSCTGGRLLGTYANHGTPDAATITVTLFAPTQPGPIVNTVRVDPSGAIPEIIETNNVNTLTSNVDVAGGALYHEFAVTALTNGPNPVAPSGTLDWHATVANSASDVAFNVALTLALPVGSVFRSATDHDPTTTGGAFTCAATGLLVTCTGGTLNGSGTTGGAQSSTSRTIDISTFAPSQPGSFTATATVDPGNAIPEANETNNTLTSIASVAVGGGGGYTDLQVRPMSASPDPVSPSGILGYTVPVTNTGTDVAFNVTVAMTLPAGARYRSAADHVPSDNGSFNCSVSQQVVTCTGGTLNGSVTTGGAGTLSTRTIDVSTFAPAAPGNYTLSTVIDPANAIPEANEGNNSRTLTSQDALGGGGGYIDLVLDKQLAVPVPATPKPGQQFSIPLVVQNVGTDQAFNVELRDNLPPGVSFVSAADSANTNGAFTCTQNTGTVDCTGGSIPGSGSRTVNITVLAPTTFSFANPVDVSETVTNSAAVDPTNAIPEADETNNTAAVNITVRPDVNFHVDTDGPDTANQSTNADFHITVHNDGGSTANGVKLHDALPVGLIPLNATVEGVGSAGTPDWQCTITQNPVNVLDCIGSLPAGSAVKITVSTFVTAADGTSLYNRATADPDGQILETNEIDNTVLSSTPVTAPEVSLNASQAFGTVNPGQTQQYTVIASNIGTGPATAVTVTDTLPSGLTYISSTATNGFTCTATGSTVTCVQAPAGSLAAGANTVINIIAKVSATASGSVTNSAHVDAPGDTNTTDNDASSTAAVGSTGVDLAVTSVTDTPDPGKAGSVLTYTVQVLNGGTADVAGATLTLGGIAPSGVAYQSAGGDGFTCSLTAPSVTCTGDLPAGTAKTIIVKETVNAGAPSTITVVATVAAPSGTTDADLTNNSKTVQTSVVPGCSSCKEVVVSPLTQTTDHVTPGGTQTYNVSATNVGDQAITNASKTAEEVDIKLDPELNFVGATTNLGADWSCALGSTPPYPANTVVCKGNLNAGQGVVISVQTTVPNPTLINPDFFITTARAVPLPNEFDISNNDASIEAFYP